MIEINDELLDGDELFRITDRNGNVLQNEVGIQLITRVLQQPTPHNKQLFRNLYNDMTPCGIIKTFGSSRTMEGYLLCNGSSVMGIDYPDLINRTRTYEVYEYLTMQDITGYQVAIRGKLCVANNKFFMMSMHQNNPSERQKVWVSDDGITWTRILLNYEFSNGNDVLRGVFYVNNTYYIFAEQQQYMCVFYGSDLSSLTRVRIRSSTERNMLSVVYNGGLFVVHANSDNTNPYNFVYYSSDAITWTQAGGDTVGTSVFPTSTSTRYNTLQYTNNKFFLSIISGTSTYQIFSSTNAEDWTGTSVSSADDLTSGNDFSYNGYVWRASGNTLKRSTDCITWETYKTLDSSADVVSVFVDVDGRYFFGSSTGDNWVSDDLNTFKRLRKESTLTSLVSNGDVAIGVNDGVFYKYDINYINPKLILPTLLDTTNRLYGYIKTEVE